MLYRYVIYETGPSGNVTVMFNQPERAERYLERLLPDMAVRRKGLLGLAGKKIIRKGKTVKIEVMEEGV